jgi:hypothetical protein
MRRPAACRAGADRFAHAGTLSFEMSVGRDRLIVNCGAAPAAEGEWRDALRATAAHSALILADTNSSELRPEGLGRRVEKVEVDRQEANGAQWLEVSHDGWVRQFGLRHRRRFYLSESGDDLRGEDVLEPEREVTVPASSCASTCTPRWSPACSRTRRACCCACPPASAGGCAPRGARRHRGEHLPGRRAAPQPAGRAACRAGRGERAMGGRPGQHAGRDGAGAAAGVRRPSA